ncbi:hypothetical protein KW795_02835, partial [Candidatus Microgenomates bacterium]|nr:hypothetical protein [Candidatus Microgenomates bacterium]
PLWFKVEFEKSDIYSWEVNDMESFSCFFWDIWEQQWGEKNPEADEFISLIVNGWEENFHNSPKKSFEERCNYANTLREQIPSYTDGTYDAWKKERDIYVVERLALFMLEAGVEKLPSRVLDYLEFMDGQIPAKFLVG